MPAELNGGQKKPKAGGLTPLDVNTYYEATVIMIKCCLGKGTQTDQLNRIGREYRDTRIRINFIF